MTWHEDAHIRESLGRNAEAQFAMQVICHCGGRFERIGHLRPGFPDFTCSNCGALVDVKSSPQAEQTGNIAVSAVPWQHYPDEMLLVTRIRGVWLGEYKRNIAVSDDTPRKPTHSKRHGRLKNTRFYLVSWRQFRPLAELGFSIVS